MEFDGGGHRFRREKLENQLALPSPPPPRRPRNDLRSGPTPSGPGWQRVGTEQRSRVLGKWPREPRAEQHPPPGTCIGAASPLMRRRAATAGLIGGGAAGNVLRFNLRN